MTQKFLLSVAAGTALLLAALTSAQAQHRGHGDRPIRGYSGGGVRNGGGGNFNRYHGGYRGGHNGYRHRYYHRGSYFYYDPFFFGGIGYPAYYGGFGPGFGVGYAGYGDGYGYGERVYQGRIASDVNRGNGRRNDGDEDEGGARDGNGGDRYSPTAMARAVQSELKERGYYRGTVDGQFGDGSASALRSFQRDKGLKVTGQLDERTLKALGFDER